MNNKQLILIVDDEPHILKALHYILSKEGYPVVTARDAEEALVLVKKEHPALIVADIMLPGMDGYELCSKIRTRDPVSLTPFIFLSAKDSVDDRIRGIKTGADAYLTKPFNREEVLVMVETVLGRHAVYTEQTMRDELTGLPNRAYIFKVLADEFARARRYRRDLCVVMSDLDQFKAVNDRYGHLAGDRVLARIAETLRAEIRQQDVIGRYGGEEFIIVLPETTGASGGILMERCRKKIAAIPWEDEPDHLSINVTLSAGIAELKPSDRSIDDLINRADRAMYRAKAEGRNRVVTAE